jgi:hypothetical protein
VVGWAASCRRGEITDPPYVFNGLLLQATEEKQRRLDELSVRMLVKADLMVDDSEATVFTPARGRDSGGRLVPQQQDPGMTRCSSTY